MKIGLRILLGYFLIVGLAAWFLLNVFVEEVRPGVKATLEDTMHDTASLLAVLVADEVKAGKVEGSALLARVRQYAEAGPATNGEQARLGYRIYVTDERGIVLFDSEGKATGQDYSRWNDVYLTLQGKYGTRTTRADPLDDASAVMYVAAPVRDGERTIGVLTVAKPFSTVQPFVKRSQQNVMRGGALVMGLSLLIGIALAWRLTRSLGKLSEYAATVEAGGKATLPALGSGEIGMLGRALEAMRVRLEGKQYAEQLMHTLAHELKSPIAAIQGSAELMREEMPEEQRAHFLGNILEQNTRQKQLIERLLALVQVEQQQQLASPAPIAVRALLAQVEADSAARLMRRRQSLRIDAAELVVRGDALLLRQAIGNLVDNAADFAPSDSEIVLRAAREGEQLVITVRDQGDGIPEFARERLFERFYSLPRPDGARSTGLGLTFVREVAILHGGSAAVASDPAGGACATLRLAVFPQADRLHPERIVPAHAASTIIAFQPKEPAMQKTLLFKILAIGAMMILIGISLILIQVTIEERMAFRKQAVGSIAADSVGQQALVGPVLVIPYTDEFDEQVIAADPAKKAEAVRRQVERRHIVFPNELNVAGSFDTDSRYRGIHKVLVFSGQHAFTGNFDLPAQQELPRANASSRLTLGRPFVAVSIGDVRGIRNTPKLNWDGQAVEFRQGSGLLSMKSGLHAPLAPLPLAAPARAKFSFELGLDGMESQQFAPVAKQTTVALKSNWPHPQFGGHFLPSPKNRVVKDDGFSAVWNISSLASDTQQQLRRAELTPVADAKGSAIDKLSVAFIEPVNVYSLADRAIKYGIVFVALTFAAFFVFEILRRLPIHPIEYLLVGLALALFFLLLVSLSEHIDFVLAYVVASAACTGLIGFYLSFVLHDWRRGMGFGAALAVLYCALYGLLISENNALMLGSFLLFAVLAAMMVATRKVDWYQVGKPVQEPSIAG
ncbi:MAG: two-component system sensor histidine kinase CreC [Pseudomonadota bacterium]